MRIALSAGHNVYIGNNFDPGATGNGLRESDITKETVAILKTLLKAQGHVVVDVTPYGGNFRSSKEHHQLRADRADGFNADLLLDIHLNAFNGQAHGSECFIYSKSSASYTYAEKILDNITKDMDLTNRGVKVNPSYYSLYMPTAPAIIIEGAFIDNKSDMEKLTANKYATAIAKAFGGVGVLGVVDQSENKLDKIKINLHGREFEVEGIFENGTNYIPIRTLENLGYDVDWKNNTVMIKYNENK